MFIIENLETEKHSLKKSGNNDIIVPSKTHEKNAPSADFGAGGRGEVRERAVIELGEEKGVALPDQALAPAGVT